jgi:hypothetical protein
VGVHQGNTPVLDRCGNDKETWDAETQTFLTFLPIWLHVTLFPFQITNNCAENQPAKRYTS